MTLKLTLMPLLAAVAFGQVRPYNPRPANVDFRAGETGQIPPGWRMAQPVMDAGYRAELRREGCGERFAECVVYLAPARIDNVRAAALMQTFPAEPYLGKIVHFSAWLRAEGSGSVEIRMRVDHGVGPGEIFDSAAPPVATNQWQRRDVTGKVAGDAVTISIWARYFPSGVGWVASPAFEVLDSPWNKEDEAAIRGLIAKFSELRNRHDGAGVAALYSEQGEWMGASYLGISGAVTHGRAALQELWGGVTGQVERTIESVTPLADGISAVRVAADVGPPPGTRREAFVVVKEGGTWRIRLHQLLE